MTELFLPVHYKIGMALEDALRCGQLSRKQVAILWLMRSERDAEGKMRRKDIERLLAAWFETSSSTITRALRDMARAPLNLVRLVEDPASAREKQVILTSKGQRFIQTMEEEGKKFLLPHLGQMPRAEIKELLREHETKGFTDESISISLSWIGGKKSLDTLSLALALQDHGLKIEDFQREGNGYERLAVKLKEPKE